MSTTPTTAKEQLKVCESILADTQMERDMADDAFRVLTAAATRVYNAYNAWDERTRDDNWPPSVINAMKKLGKTLCLPPSKTTEKRK